MLTVGLTGNIASGKSEVARRLANLGATIVDADVLAREVVEPGTPALAEIAKRWGNGVLEPSGRLDRAALRKIVFASRHDLDALNAIVHPRVDERRRQLFAEARERGDSVVVYDVPLLFERQMENAFDVVVLVDAPEPVRRERLMARQSLDSHEAERMIASQLPSREKRERADFIVDNDGDLASLDARVAQLWDVLQRRATQR